MKFSDLKNAVSGETILIDNNGFKRVYYGIFNKVLICQSVNRDNEEMDETVLTKSERNIFTWTIKKPKPKLRGPYWKWEHLGSSGSIVTTASYSSKFFSTPSKYVDIWLKNSRWKRKISDPIYINDETGIPCNEKGEELK